MLKGIELFKHAQKRFPGGGTQLLSKHPFMRAPGLWPAYYKEAHGCEIIDYDDRHFYDFATNGIAACALGFADPDVSAAVIEAVRKGSMCSQNCYEEVQLADRLCQIHPWAECVRFARTGGETAAVAARIARATTDRSRIAICGYSGWTDWYIAMNLGADEEHFGKVIDGMQPWGVPRELRGTSLAFHFDNFEEFDKIIRENRGKLAAVFMEPVRWAMPAKGFLEHIREVCSKEGILLIFDEITAGWRLTFGGSHKILGVTPDMAVFAKALGNGHPVGAVIGTKAAMDGANKAFISSTYWTERVGSVAALATLDKMEKINVSKIICDTGREFMTRMSAIAAAHGVEYTFRNQMELPALIKPQFANEQESTFFTEQMLNKGFIHSDIGYDPTAAHTPEIRELFYKAADETFGQLAMAKKRGNLSDLIQTGDMENKKGFGRLN